MESPRIAYSSISLTVQIHVPQPLCELHFNNARLFTYHSKDVHCLDMDGGKKKWQPECRTDLFVHYASDTVGQARKRKQLDKGFHESKMRKVVSSSQLSMVEHLNEVQCVSLCQLPKVDDSQLVLPELSRDGSTPDLDELYLDEPKHRDSVEAKPDICVLSSCDDDLFSQFLKISFFIVSPE